MVKLSQRREMARRSVESGRTIIRHACQTFALRETGNRYLAKASFRLFDLLDDFNREKLSIEVDLSLPSVRVIRALAQIIEWHGKPRLIHCDNVLDYISGTLLTWAEQAGIPIAHIQPGKLQQNAFVERYNRTVRYAWLARTLFDSIEQVQDAHTR
jgi:putative transposase